MANQKSEHVVLSVLLDESGSMAGTEASVVSSYNEFIEQMRKSEEADGKDVRATLAMFDLTGGQDVVRVKHDGVPLAEVTDLADGDYTPRGATPLNDAVLYTIQHVAKAGPDRALVVILTDGYENSSEASTEDVRKAIQEREAEGWRFIYMGANQDAWAEGGARGVAVASTHAFTSSPEGTRQAIRTMVNKGTAYMSSSAALDSQAQREYQETGNVIPEREGKSTPDPKGQEKGRSAAEKAREGLR